MAITPANPQFALHGRVGHVFQGRYKAILVEKDSYLLELCRYIVLNPVRAAMVRLAVEWPWSSYRATAGYERGLKALDIDWILSAFGEKRAKAVESYETFVADGKNQPSPWEKLKNQVYLGSDQFVDQMQQRIERPERLSEIPRSQRRPLAKALQFYKDSAPSRNEAIHLAYASGGYGLKEIGDFFGIHYSRVSRI
ncbi:addiction module toxin RelE, partial [Marinobacter caseinilyticus]|uniref:addiction module toxin RelE n=1 Tax=Marinobacter caseinilyticus TaxID=2692195 RepID=UPI001407B8BD